MKIKYQLVVLGDYNGLKNNIVDTFHARVKELGLEEDSTTLIDEENFYSDYKPNCPTVCIYFGKSSPHNNSDIIDILINDAVFIVPVVSDLTNFSNLVPKQLKPINGFELKDLNGVEATVARILEGLAF